MYQKYDKLQVNNFQDIVSDTKTWKLQPKFQCDIPEKMLIEIYFAYLYVPLLMNEASTAKA